MIAPVALPLSNNSRVSSAQVFVQVQLRCLSMGVGYVAQQSTTIAVPPDPSQQPGVDTLAIAKFAVPIPSGCVSQNSPTHAVDGTFVLSYSQSGTATGSLLSNFWVGKPFNAANFRSNLVTRTGQNNADYQAHHQFPQKYRDQFAKVELDIDDPQWGRWWCSKSGVATNHQSQAGAYNARWDTFFAGIGTPSQAQILTFMRSIQNSFTYSC